LKSPKKYAAFFDLDNTIFNINSGKLIIERSIEQKRLSRSDVAMALILSLGFRAKLISPEYIMRRMSSWLNGVDEQDFISFIDKLFESQLKHVIRSAAVKEIEQHRLADGLTGLLSASTNYVCNHIKKMLSMDEIICTEMQVINGRLSGLPIGAYCYGQEKAKRLRKYCQKNTFRLEETYYYGDSMADLAVLEIVGHPVCVSPEPALKKIAGQRGWPIVIWD
jgi:HAD superfamily hydrolase (TIGR01490 family)